MREIDCGLISNAVSKLCIQAETVLPPALAILLECAYEGEPSETGKAALLGIIERFNKSAMERVPVCSKTGLVTVFADIGQEIHISGGCFEDTVRNSILRAYTGEALSKFYDTNSNMQTVLHTRLVSGDKLDITVSPSCFTRENSVAAKVFTPKPEQSEFEAFILQASADSFVKTCPPAVLGIGIGGSFEQCALAAKRALIRQVDKHNKDEQHAAMERRLLGKLNTSGSVRHGVSSWRAAVAVNIEALPVSGGALNCVVNTGCHAGRSARVILY